MKETRRSMENDNIMLFNIRTNREKKDKDKRKNKKKTHAKENATKAHRQQT